jgi:uncharacterized membrane protein YjgN (DUF898 family)
MTINNFDNPPPLTSDTDFEQSMRTWRFAFRGNASEYFKIWIVNIFLTIITLSLYAPWAKVRRLRYFYGNTYLNRRKFDFTGIPSRILIGRLIAIGAYIVVSLFSQWSTTTMLIGFILIFVTVPWLFHSTMRFMSRNSKYENTRFHFSSSLKHSYAVFIGCALVTLFSFGLLLPLAIYWYKSWQINHLQVGQLKLQMNAQVGKFFAAILLPYLVLILIIAAIVVLSMTITMAGMSNEPLLFLIGVLYLFALFYLTPLIQGYLFKTIWSDVNIGNSRLSNTISPWRFAWIQMCNNFAMVLSLGLLFPWATIRIYRYKIESLSIEFYDDPEKLYNLAQQDSNAIAEEISDIFDIDISL